MTVMPARTVLSQAPSVPALPTQSSQLALHLAEEEAEVFKDPEVQVSPS